MLIARSRGWRHPFQDPARASDGRNRRTTMLWTILVILLVLWLLGVIGSVGGGFIHLLLVLAIIVFVAQLLTSRSSSV